MYRLIPVEQIHASHRDIVGDYRCLVESIRLIGIVEPLIVRPVRDDGYEVVSGRRRLAAAIDAGMTSAPCIVRKIADAEQVAIEVASNVARADRRPIDEAVAYAKLMASGRSIPEIAAIAGVSQRSIQRHVDLLRLPTRIQQRVNSGAISVQEATTLLPLHDQPAVIDRLLSTANDRRELTRAVRREVARISSEARRAEVVAEFSRQGIRILERWSRRRGWRNVVALGKRPTELDIDVASHRHEPCHAAFVSHSGEVTHLCTTPSRHERLSDRPG